uniref:CePP protein n=1 Tax=Arundo donax TaxID=35708 RepID=A0A0A9B127_ARUDO
MISLDHTIWTLLETGNNFQHTCHRTSLNDLNQLEGKLQLHWSHRGWIKHPKVTWRDA